MEIFQNIFQDIFLSNCGNPINFEQTETAFKKHMGGSLNKNQMKELGKLFKRADLTNVSPLFLPHSELRCYVSGLICELWGHNRFLGSS